MFLSEAIENANMAEYYFWGQKGFPKDDFLAFKHALEGAQGGNAMAQFRAAWMYEHGRGVKPDVAEAYKWYKASAEQNNSSASFNLGIIYEYGRGSIPKDLNLAFYYYKKAADLGHHAAEYSVGYCYYFGYGTDKNLEIAHEYYAKAIIYYQTKLDNGSITSNEMCRLAEMHESGYGTEKSDEKALPLYKDSAEKNYIYSLDALGRFYELGKGGLKVNYGEALRLYTLSSQQGSVYAYYHLGELYYNEKGVIKDNAKAAEFYEESANRGNYTAIKKLAEMNRDGDGIPQDPAKALALYELGISQGIPIYMYDLSLWYLEGKGVPLDVVEGMRLLTDAAKKHHINALNKLGDIYYYGQYGNKKDYTLSFKYYDESVKMGSVYGCDYLGCMYSNGYEVEKNLLKAVEYYSRSDSAYANNSLGTIYEKGGKGVEQNVEKSAEYYQKAMKKGSAPAAYNLARMYKDGIYFRQDMEQAVVYYKKSAKMGDKTAIDWLEERKIDY
jgi:TPR repeat protein